MELLLMELDRQGVQQVWVESRKPSQDARDLRMLDAVRSKELVPTSLRLDFALPKAEPMLWIPDAVAGAVGAARMEEDALPRDLAKQAMLVMASAQPTRSVSGTYLALSIAFDRNPALAWGNVSGRYWV